LFGLIAPSLIAVLAALASGGSMAHWGRARLRWSPLALVALGVQLPLYSAPFNTWGPVIAIGAGAGIATTALVLLVVLGNARGPLRLAGGLAALGIVLNLTVMLANGGWMPRADAIAPRAIQRAAEESAVVVNNTTPMDTETRLAWLGDVIAQPGWVPMANLVSLGDLLLAFGAAGCAFAITRGRLPVQADLETC
jgi:Family of unknown function (DUF5317)